MPHQNTIFQQLFNFIPRHRFDKKVEELKMDNYCKKFTAWKQFLTILYAQATGKDSLREIESGLTSNHRKLYHLGLEATPKSTLSEAMNRRDSSIYEEIFSEALCRAQSLAPKHKFKFNNPLHSFDSTTISLCLSVFDWARYRKRKGAIKLHVQLNHSGHLPCFVVMSDGKRSDIKQAKTSFAIDPDSIYCVDRGYYDLLWFKAIDEAKAFFVTRLKINADIMIAGQHREPNEKLGILEDNIVEFSNALSFKKYSKKLRLIKFYDQVKNKIYSFLTNNFKLAASTVAEIYHQRWQIEIFFKWIKQNLKIKSFLGTSQNAVMSQVWIAMIYYLILAYIKYLSKVGCSLLEISRRIKECLMERLNLIELLAMSREMLKKPPNWNQIDEELDLFSFCYS